MLTSSGRSQGAVTTRTPRLIPTMTAEGIDMVVNLVMADKFPMVGSPPTVVKLRTDSQDTARNLAMVRNLGMADNLATVHNSDMADSLGTVPNPGTVRSPDMVRNLVMVASLGMGTVDSLSTVGRVEMRSGTERRLKKRGRGQGVATSGIAGPSLRALDGSWLSHTGRLECSLPLDTTCDDIDTHLIIVV